MGVGTWRFSRWPGRARASSSGGDGGDIANRRRRIGVEIRTHRKTADSLLVRGYEPQMLYAEARAASWIATIFLEPDLLAAAPTRALHAATDYLAEDLRAPRTPRADVVVAKKKKSRKRIARFARVVRPRAR
jgi:hypothetical protein